MKKSLKKKREKEKKKKNPNYCIYTTVFVNIPIRQIPNKPENDNVENIGKIPLTDLQGNMKVFNHDFCIFNRLYFSSKSAISSSISVLNSVIMDGGLCCLNLTPASLNTLAVIRSIP